MPEEEQPQQNLTQTPPIPHQRDLACDAAGKEMVAWIREWAGRHSLTAIEMLYIFNVVAGMQMKVMGDLERQAVLAKEKVL